MTNPWIAKTAIGEPSETGRVGARTLTGVRRLWAVVTHPVAEAFGTTRTHGSMSATRRGLSVLVAAALLPLSACGGTLNPSASSSHPSSAPDRGLRPLRIALDYTANVDYLGIYAAIDKGYFKAQKIDPQIIPYAGTSAETLLAAHQADLGLTYPPNIPAYRASGLDYEAVAGLTQSNTIGIAVLASSSYTSVAQLSGTLYGGFGVSSDKPMLEEVFRRAGVAHPVVNEVNLGDSAYQALAAHRVAYSIVFGGIDDVTAELSGVKLRVFSIQHYLGAASSFPDDVFVANASVVTHDPDLLRRGLAALAQGYRFAVAHPAEAEAWLEKDNGAALAHSANIIAATGAATTPLFLTSSGRWGPMNDADFSGITEILVAGGLIKASEAPLPSQDYTNSLLP